MKILRNLCLHFARQDGQDGKKRKENHATKVTKRRKYGMKETFESSLKYLLLMTNIRVGFNKRVDCKLHLSTYLHNIFVYCSCTD